VALVVAVSILFLPSDFPPQCQDPHFARVNPGLCFDTPFPTFPPVGGGGGNGGLLGGIGRILHGITGGLL
jgi:hypothetical protein